MNQRLISKKSEAEDSGGIDCIPLFFTLFMVIGRLFLFLIVITVIGDFSVFNFLIEDIEQLAFEDKFLPVYKFYLMGIIFIGSNYMGNNFFFFFIPESLLERADKERKKEIVSRGIKD